MSRRLPVPITFLFLPTTASASQSRELDVTDRRPSISKSRIMAMSGFGRAQRSSRSAWHWQPPYLERLRELHADSADFSSAGFQKSS